MPFQLRLGTLIMALMIITPGTLAQEKPTHAFVCVPVADLTTQPIATIYQSKDALDKRQQLPFSSTKKSQQFLEACPRVHQLLFNEMVTVLEECADELRVSIHNSYYLTAQSEQPQTIYWGLKKDFVFLNTLSDTDQQKIPTPIISFDHQASIEPRTRLVTLQQPFTDPISKHTFSAGTRFVRAVKKNPPATTATQEKKYYDVFIFDAVQNRFIVTAVPRDLCAPLTLDGKDARISYFVRLLREWAKTDNGSIPYVFGGCSIVSRLKKNEFQRIDEPLTPTITIGYYQRTGIKPGTRVGIDCSGLVTRAAHIAGIPYFFKNSRTLGQKLTPLSPQEPIQNGDLILFRGHVIIITDVHHNLIVEARSYDHGYGIIHEIALGKVFKGIETFGDLHDAYRKGTPLVRLNSKGEVEDSFNSWKILKIKSVWPSTRS